jgi:hypothetical protein
MKLNCKIRLCFYQPHPFIKNLHLQAMAIWSAVQECCALMHDAILMVI